MKRLRLKPLLVLLPLTVSTLSCIHYDPNRPKFTKADGKVDAGQESQVKTPSQPIVEGNPTPSTPSDKSESGGEQTTPSPAPIDADQTAGTRPDKPLNEGEKEASQPELPPTRQPNPMTGPGMEMTVPMPDMTKPIVEQPKPREPVKPKPPATYNEALAAVDAAKKNDPHLQNYVVGAGYDMLTGNRTTICLEPGSLRTEAIKIQETNDTYSVSHDYRDLYDRLENEFGADIGGIWQIFTGKVSAKTKILRETRIASDDVVVMAGYTFVRNRIQLTTPATEHAAFFRSVGIRDKHLFRKYCGDKLTKDVSIGASMHLVFTARKVDSTKHNRNDVEAAIRLGLAGIIDVGVSGSTSKEQKEILKSYSFSAKCYTLGASSDVCGGYQSVTSFDINGDLRGFQQRVGEVKNRMAREVSEGKNLVVVKETLVDYEVPGPRNENDDELAGVKRWDYFVDYRDRLGKVKRMSLDKAEAAEVCTMTPYWPRRCARVAELFDEHVQSCMSFDNNCSIPNDNEFQAILTAKDPGWVTIYEHQNFKGAAWTFDFKDLRNNKFKPNTYYEFTSIGLKGAHDKATAARSDLKRNWTVRFYEHHRPHDRGRSYDIVGRQEYSWLDGPFNKTANDKFSAFELIPFPDL